MLSLNAAIVITMIRLRHDIQEVCLNLLSQRTLQSLRRNIRRHTGTQPYFVDPTGQSLRFRESLPDTDDLRRNRLYAIHESVKLGESVCFELCPGIHVWLIAIENKRIVHGGLIGGEALCSDEPVDRETVRGNLVSLGMSNDGATAYIAALPCLSRAVIRDAASYLMTTFYAISGWQPLQLRENHLRTQQQRQLAMAIDERKRRGDTVVYPFEKERVLLSLIKTGDRNGARKALNEMLAVMYMTSPKLALLRARAIELMGYLTRAALEDSPLMEPLIERNHTWMARLIEARDFEALSRTLIQALEDFIDGIYLQGFNNGNPHIGRILEIIANRYATPLSLRTIAADVGLSTYRVAHLIRAATGKTVLQLIQQTRIRHARQLLEQTDKPCTEIAYEVGYGNQSYFIKHFRRQTGCTPARYRQQFLKPPRRE